VWNKALAIKTHRYRTRGQKLNGKRDLKPLLAVGKRSRKYSWLGISTGMADAGASGANPI
jgi:putative transposase